jgi:SAM domain (Sterile alpha motif)
LARPSDLHRPSGKSLQRLKDATTQEIRHDVRNRLPHLIGQKGCGPHAFPQAKTKSAGDGAAMKQIADWLEKLGLGQYAQRFAENDISFSILSDLTDQDLEKIGVASRSSTPVAARNR